MHFLTRFNQKEVKKNIKIYLSDFFLYICIIIHVNLRTISYRLAIADLLTSSIVTQKYKN